MQVDKKQFDALLGKLIAAKPLPKSEINAKQVRAARAIPKPAKHPVPRP